MMIERAGWANKQMIGSFFFFLLPIKRMSNLRLHRCQSQENGNRGSRRLLRCQLQPWWLRRKHGHQSKAQKDIWGHRAKQLTMMTIFVTLPELMRLATSLRLGSRFPSSPSNTTFPFWRVELVCLIGNCWRLFILKRVFGSIHMLVWDGPDWAQGGWPGPIRETTWHIHANLFNTFCAQ